MKTSNSYSYREPVHIFELNTQYDGELYKDKKKAIYV